MELGTILLLGLLFIGAMGLLFLYVVVKLLGRVFGSDDGMTTWDSWQPLDEAGTVEAGDEATHRFTLSGSTELTLDAAVRSGPALDFLVLSEEEFEHYERGDRFREEGVSAMDATTVSKTSETLVDRGKYVFVVRNEGDESATYDLEMAAEAKK